jgi:hypothetical protein
MSPRPAPVDTSGPSFAPLFAVAAPPPPPAGRHELAVAQAVDLEGSPLRDGRNAGARTMLLALARALDAAEAKGNPYAVAQIVRPMRDLMSDCGLLPDLADHGPADDTLAGLGAATLGD